MTGWLLLALGAAVGAPARYLADRHLPQGILLVNVAGSFVLGVVVGLGEGHAVPEGVVLAVGTGFCGALTTYSTFGYETVRLFESGARSAAVLNVAATLVVGLLAALVGVGLGSAL